MVGKKNKKTKNKTKQKQQQQQKHILEDGPHAYIITRVMVLWLTLFLCSF